MRKIDQKMAVMTALESAKRALSLAELQLSIPNASPRSIRRWLQELIQSNAVQKLGKGRETRYAILATSPANEPIIIFSPLSHPAIQYLSHPIYLRDPVPYRSEWLEQYQPNIDSYLTATQKEMLMSQGQHTEFGMVAGTYARHIYNRLLIDLSYNSSRLEGNTYSLLDTEKLLLEGIDVSNKLNEEKVMILNHKEAIRYIVDNAAKIKVTPDTVCAIQYLLSEGLLPPEHCGTLRNHGVKIGGSTYLPIDNPKYLSSQLIAICDKASLIENPFEKSFFLLVHLAYLQAFEDCNRRTSRLCANIPLIQKNLVPLSFNDIPKNDYINAMLAIYELNDIHPLADLYVFSYTRTCKLYDSTVQVMGIDRLRVVYREERRELIRHIITHRLKSDKMSNYLQEQIALIIPEIDQKAFLKVIQEDISLLNIPRIAGLSISITDFNQWKDSP